MSAPTDELERARAELETAADLADDDVRDEISEVGAAFGALLSGEEMADYAVFDQHLNRLRQIREGAGSEPTPHLDTALEHAETYREGIEQA